MNTSMQPWKSLSASLQLGILTEGWNLASPATVTCRKTPASFVSLIYFAAPFDAPPVVHLGLTGFDFDQRDGNRLALRAGSEITPSSFVVEVSTWRDTRVYSGGV